MRFALDRSQIQNNDRFESILNKLALFLTLCFVWVVVNQATNTSALAGAAGVHGVTCPCGQPGSSQCG